MDKKATKVNLDLLKKLVNELESALTLSNNIKDSKAGDVSQYMSEYVVEMSKASGLAAGVMTEASLIVTDIQALIFKASGGSPTLDKLDVGAFDKFMGALKGSIPGSGTGNSGGNSN